MTEVPFNIRFQTKEHALRYARLEASKFKRNVGYKAVKGRYWSMDLMDYVSTWIAILIF